MAKLAESDSIYPAFVGTILVCIFFGWSLYALSGAGIIRRLPFLKLSIILIACLCIVRGLYGFFILLLFNSPYVVNLGVWFSKPLVRKVDSSFLILGLFFYL